MLLYICFFCSLWFRRQQANSNPKRTHEIRNSYTKTFGYYINRYIITNKDSDSIDLILKEISDLGSYQKYLKQYKKTRTKDRFPLVIARPIGVTLTAAVPIVIVCPIMVGLDSGPLRDLPNGLTHNYLDPVIKTAAFPYYIFKDIIDDKNTLKQMEKYSIAKNIRLATEEQIELFIVTYGKSGSTDFTIKKENDTHKYIIKNN